MDGAVEIVDPEFQRSAQLFSKALGNRLVSLLETSRAQEQLEGKIDAFLGEPVLEVQSLFKNERFPNIVVTLEGTVVATWGSSNIRVCRSEDGGKTWGKKILGRHLGG